VTIALLAHVAAGLVAVAGIGKVLRPDATRDALALTQLPAATGAIRMLGAGEVALAVAVLATGHALAFGALAAAYAGFLLVAVRQRRAGRGCGCFGATEDRVSGLHLGVNAVAAVIAGAAAIVAPQSLLAVLPGAPVAAVLTVVLLATAIGLVRLLLTALPDLHATRALVEVAR
jgi:hypothetical protein